MKLMYVDTLSAVVDVGGMNGVFCGPTFGPKKIPRHSDVPISVGSEIVVGGFKPSLPVGSCLRVRDTWVFAFRVEQV